MIEYKDLYPWLISETTAKDIDDPRAAEIDGALTPSKLSQIPKDCGKIILKDFTKVFISDHELIKLSEKTEILFENYYHLNFVVVNLYDIPRDEFDEMLSTNNIDLKIIYNPFQARTKAC